MLKPQEVHNHARSFSNKELSSMPAGRVEGFVRIFGSVTPLNPHWVGLVLCSTFFELTMILL
jgi:hypothetical protein